ncbi:MAG TPA: histidine phosphatase family protein [Vitreimonas sp.]|uniref:histidine phosphatase family protein n=1 Tax=Vitreimonas sp. TaxID=3069702 RepID=UPI002D60E222|nr:histidine phosphatase family protein [Vitreimonas sp.]HYD88110.1 histidine phosphatase family protein [Vitreimonas sp.]
MKETRVYFVRHGAVERQTTRLSGRTPHLSLTRAGRAQAEAAALALSGRGIETVMTSPLERAQETAEVIAGAAGAALLVDDDLNEIDFGDWSGAMFETLAGDPEWRIWNEDRGRARPPHGESMLEAQARVARWLERARASAHNVIAAVSHGDVVRAAVAYTLGLPLHFYDRFDIDPGSITAILMRGAEARLISMNERPHVPTD